MVIMSSRSLPLISDTAALKSIESQFFAFCRQQLKHSPPSRQTSKSLPCRPNPATPPRYQHAHTPYMPRPSHSFPSPVNRSSVRRQKSISPIIPSTRAYSKSSSPKSTSSADSSDKQSGLREQPQKEKKNSLPQWPKLNASIPYSTPLGQFLNHEPTPYSPKPYPVTTNAKDLKDPAKSVHLLGNEKSSMYLAYALQDTYDDIYTIRFPFSYSKYSNIAIHDGPRSKVIFPNTLSKVVHESEDETRPIRNLIVTGHAERAAVRIGRIKNRVNDDTTICLWNDGLGVVENVHETVFRDEKRQPGYVLGHFSRQLYYDRQVQSLVAPQKLQTRLTASVPEVTTTIKPSSNTFINNMRCVDMLNAVSPPYESWMAQKLQPLIFYSAVEPVCSFLESTYGGVLDNPWGIRMVDQLLHELCQVIARMPEVRKSPMARRLLEDDNIRKSCFRRLHTQASAMSQMVCQIRNCKPTNIDFYNGYFVRRGEALGVPCPANQWAISMVKAKIAVYKNQIPIEFSTAYES